jgi:hypothetical protein
VFTQFGVDAVHLVAAHEVQPHTIGEGVGEDVDDHPPLVRNVRSSGTP